MYCNNCGAKLPDDSKFCSNCGKQIKIVDDVKEKAVWCNFEDTNSKQEEVAEIYDPHEFANEIREKVRRHEEQEAERLKQEERKRKKREQEEVRRKKEKEIEAFLDNDRYYNQLLIKQRRIDNVHGIFFCVACVCTLVLGIYFFPEAMREKLAVVQWLNISGTWLETIFLFVWWLFVTIISGIVIWILLAFCIGYYLLPNYETKLDLYKKNIRENWEQRIRIRDEAYKKMKKK